MSVFISYYRPDESLAKEIARLLRTNNIHCYLDVLDDRLSQASNVTRAILDALHESTHLMALVSTSTAGSWWVPFEIGVATETGRRICSYATTAVRLPDFLREWPVLRSRQDLQDFMRRYRLDSGVLRKTFATPADRSAAMREADRFHTMLKRDLGQL